MVAMSKFNIRKRDNSQVGHGEWAVDELMGNEFCRAWVEVKQGSYDDCCAWVAAAS